MDGPAEPSSPRVPGYEILRVLGRGGFATVYEARQLSVDRLVALKVVSVGMLGPETERRFRGELRTVGSLSWHPHIVGVHDGGVTPDGLPFLSMELVAGGSWGDRIRTGGPVLPEEAVRVAAEIADALAAAHEAGIVHRDVKPDNVLVGRRGEALLTDFGIATLADVSHTATGTFVGTIAYSAPEVLKGERASPASDVYALGATLRALLAGRAPFTSSDDITPAAMMLRVISEEPAPLPADIPRDLADLVDRTMARDPSARPRSASEVEATLRAWSPASPRSEAATRVLGAGPTERAEAPRPVPGPSVAPPTPHPTPPPSAPSGPPPPSPTPPPAPAPAPSGPPFAPPVVPVAATPPPPPGGVGWAPAPAPHPFPPPPGLAPKASGLAIGGLVASVLCCPPVGLGLTIGGHVQVRRGTRVGRGWVWAGYGVAAVVGLAWTALLVFVVVDAGRVTDRYIGTWSGGADDSTLTIELAEGTLGMSVEGTFTSVTDGVTCRGGVDEASRTGERLTLTLTGPCDDGTTFDRDLKVDVADDGATLDVEGGPVLLRTGS